MVPERVATRPALRRPSKDRATRNPGLDLRTPLLSRSARAGAKVGRRVAATPFAGDVDKRTANELVDALPVHLVELHHGHLKEVWVNYAPEKGFTTVLADISIGQLADYFEFVGIDFRSGYAEGYRTEVNLAALDWLAQIERKLKRGYLLTIDYGYTAQRYYSPARKEGTLQCYYQHSHHNDPFIHIGEQDITAHVDFTALEKQGEKLGLEKLGFLQQGLFLMALGLGDRLATLAQPDKAQPATGKDPATLHPLQSLYR